MITTIINHIDKNIHNVFKIKQVNKQTNINKQNKTKQKKSVSLEIKVVRRYNHVSPFPMKISSRVLRWTAQCRLCIRYAERQQVRQDNTRRPLRFRNTFLLAVARQWRRKDVLWAQRWEMRWKTEREVHWVLESNRCLRD